MRQSEGGSPLSLLAQPQNAAYLSFLSDTGFIAGYTRFSQPGYRASLGATTGTRQGWFPKIEEDGWTGIAFVNVSSRTATITLDALDDNGNQVATETLTLESGKKTVGVVSQLFHQDISRAKQFRYRSDQQLLGFTVSGSGDGLMLDGLPAMPQFSKYLERYKH